MPDARADALEGRVERLAADLSALRDEYAAVRERLRALEAAVDGEPATVDRRAPSVESHEEPEPTGATQAEVERAVRRVEEPDREERELLEA